METNTETNLETSNPMQYPEKYETIDGATKIRLVEWIQFLPNPRSLDEKDKMIRIQQRLSMMGGMNASFKKRMILKVYGR